MTPTTTPSLSDTHCHLILNEFDHDREEALQRARNENVCNILIPGIDLETSYQAVEFAGKHEGVFAAVGIHPHHADEWNSSSREEILQLANSRSVVAIGEIGLDFYRNFVSPDQQHRAFHEQIEVAKGLELPIVVHNREAINEILLHLHSAYAENGGMMKGRRGVLHAFSAELTHAEVAIEEGFYIGIAGPLTYKNAETLRTVAVEIPLDRVLLETDSPFLSPDLYRGRRNEPAHLVRIADIFSKILELEYEEIVRRTSENAGNLFRWNNENRYHHIH